jgi:hypothetical protein
MTPTNAMELIMESQRRPHLMVLVDRGPKFHPPHDRYQPFCVKCVVDRQLWSWGRPLLWASWSWWWALIPWNWRGGMVWAPYICQLCGREFGKEEVWTS